MNDDDIFVNKQYSNDIEIERRLYSLIVHLARKDVLEAIKAHEKALETGSPSYQTNYANIITAIKSESIDNITKDLDNISAFIFNKKDKKYKYKLSIFNNNKDKQKIINCYKNLLTEESKQEYNKQKEKVSKIVEADKNKREEIKKKKKALKQAEDFIERWSCESKDESPKKGEQTMLKIDDYYDFYTGMTPYTEIFFRTGLSKENNEWVPTWSGINSVEHPFISSVNIKDNGVKTVTIELYDKDFASCSNFAVRNETFTANGNKNSNYYSLDQLIKASLRTDLSTESDWTKKNGIKLAEEEKKKQTKTIGITYKTGEYKDFVFSYSTDIEKVKERLKNIVDGKEIERVINTFESWKKEIDNSYLKNEKYVYNDELSSKEGNFEGNVPLDNNYLKMIDESNQVSTANIKIRFGYVDQNLKFNSGDKYKRHNVGGEKERNYRWWDATQSLGESHKIALKTWANMFDGKAEETERIIGNEANGETNSTGASIGEDKVLNSWDQTTEISREIELMITNYSSTLTSNGIKYTITAIEAKEARLMRQRFLQRFSETTDYPEGILYTLMSLFNEYNGKLDTNKKVKIVFLKDPDDTNNLTKCKLVQKYDFQNLTDEEKKAIKYSDTYNAVLNGEEIKVENLANITLSFGSQASLSNYLDITQNPPMTKSMAALMNEFCAACPPKKIEQTAKKVYDENGEEVAIDKEDQVSRPLKWFSVVDNIEEKDGKKLGKDTIYIVLYYRKEQKPHKIRQYNWGPNLPYNTCIKQINIQNKNEYALLSSVRTFNASNGTVNNRINKKNLENLQLSSDIVNVNRTSKETDILEYKTSYDFIAQNDVTSQAYAAALSSGVYEGNIELLGDPFYLFNGVIQPCTYPIRLNILVPQNETELRQPGETKKSIHEKFGTFETVGNQRIYESSGYYVIKEIEHNISSRGFITRLNILSYPNIEKHVLVN